VNNLDALVVGQPIPHAAALTAFTTAANYSATSAATYAAVGGTIDYSGTNRTGARFVTVTNQEAAKILYVNVGNTVVNPPTATAGSFPVFPGTRNTFILPQGGTPGVHGMVNVLSSSGTAAGSIQWHP
jgi:hypothetical protein